MYVNLAGFITRLTENISYDTRYLPIPQKDYDLLLQKLNSGDYSFLELKDGKAIEYVKIINICGKIVVNRGAELTKANYFHCGSTVSFQLTMQGVKDTVCQMEDCDEL